MIIGSDMRPGWTKRLLILAAVLYTAASVLPGQSSAQTQQQSDAVGLEATVPSDPPKDAPQITVPNNGQSFTNLPIRVAGICSGSYLVEVFKNGVFAGAVVCGGGSFSLQIDLFDGQNEIVARLYDSLNQAGPDSNTISVSYSSALPRSGPKVAVTSSFASRGAAPGSTLTWPISLSGGTGPYAISVDWGDRSTPDLISRAGPGDLILEHVYTQSGFYNVVIKVTDANGESSFLQVVGIGNGPIQQSQQGAAGSQRPATERVIIWWPFLLTLLLSFCAFWLGQRHQLQVIRDRLRRGERPFK